MTLGAPLDTTPSPPPPPPPTPSASVRPIFFSSLVSRDRDGDRDRDRVRLVGAPFFSLLALRVVLSLLRTAFSPPLLLLLVRSLLLPLLLLRSLLVLVPARALTLILAPADMRDVYMYSHCKKANQ